MVFSSLTFVYAFLPVVFGLYFLVPKWGKNFVLFLAGIVFYMWGEPVYVYVMLLSILIDYLCGLGLAHWDNNERMRKVMLLCSIVMNLGLLGVFKYSGFFVQTINSIFGTAIPDPGLALPIGISFYTFQSMSYTLDMYMRNIKVQKNPLTFATYVTLFPQIVAGPIVRYEDVESELAERKTSWAMASDGVSLFVAGLAKKLLIANNIGALWSVIKATPVQELPVFTAWIGILAFTFQIYYDFSGYSDMAVGLGKIMGFHFPQNFDLPYMSRSVSEFWRRWHITLGTWFRLYVYIPLGGNRKGTGRTVLNLLIVWALTGFWHGASWNFVLWGLYFGVLIILERLFLGRLLKLLPRIVGQLYTFLIVVLGWVLFEFDRLPAARDYYKAMFTMQSGRLWDSTTQYYLISYAVVFAVAILFSTRLPRYLNERFGAKALRYVKPVVVLLTLVLCTAFLVDATYNPFLYFRF